MLGRSHVLGERAVAARSFSTDTPMGPRLGVDDKPESAGASPNLVRRPGVSSSASPKGRESMAQATARTDDRVAGTAPDPQIRFAASAVIATVVAGGIYFARPILIPLALAILLAFALAPIVSALRRLHVNRRAGIHIDAAGGLFGFDLPRLSAAL